MSGRVKGWCPDLYAPMEAGDGWLVRVKPPFSRLDASMAAGVAAAAARCGNGIIEITARANLQVRGLTKDSLNEFAQTMVALGVASTNHAFEAIRNVVVSPLLDDDPGIDSSTFLIATTLLNALQIDSKFYNLPGKFGFAVDGGGVLSLASPGADMNLRATGDDWLITPNGSALSLVVAAPQAAGAAMALANLCLEYGRTRMNPLLSRVSLQDCLTKAGLDQLELVTTPPPAPPLRPGPYSYGGARPGGLLVAPRFGQLTADDLTLLADLASRYGNSSIRVTSARLLALTGLPTNAMTTVKTALCQVGMITEAHDPAYNITACPGSPHCQSGHKPARLDAAWLAGQWSWYLPGLHISGCTKGCAHPGRSPLTLVGQAGGYALILDGTASGTPATHNLTPDAALRLIRHLHANKEAPL